MTVGCLNVRRCVGLQHYERLGLRENSRQFVELDVEETQCSFVCGFD